jgi:ubiquinone/menaquinone biosynthesis C-methylase UbiE
MTSENYYSSARIPFLQKISELVSIVTIVHLRRVLKPKEEINRIFSDFEEYNHLLSQYSNTQLQSAKVLEVGFGARPIRLISLTSMGIDVRGVDIEKPVLKGSPQEFLEILKKNGAERFIKSLFRFALFDSLERYHLSQSLRQKNHQMTIQADRFLVSDAAQLDIPPASLDLIYSEDVFEHIPPDSLKALIPKMATWLKPEGLALIRPSIFTGITGGHLAEWFPQALDNPSMQRKSEPWEHLRKKRYLENTYLNQFSRADFRHLLSQSFEILEERVKDPEMGKSFFSEEVAADLTNYPEEELFSNLVMFVLKPKPWVTHSN